jgi:hypothetical protein
MIAGIEAFIGVRCTTKALLAKTIVLLCKRRGL